MITGARQGKLSGLRRLVAGAMARDLNVFLIPGPDIARAHGLDIEAAGLQRVASPRHASVLLVVGPIPPALREAAAVVYAQMVRPRALFVLGTEDLSPLPGADVATGLSQQNLLEGVRQLRHVFSESAFRPDVSDFDAPVLQVRIEYTCPMHPEVVRDEPGSCPKCGMFLVPREVQAGVGHTHADQAQADASADTQVTPAHDYHHMDHDAAVEYTCPMHPEVVQSEPGSCPKCGMDLEPREIQAEPAHDHSHMDHDAAVEYTCPMHPEVVQSEPGSCPKCGMDLEPREITAEPAHDHQHMNHSAMDHDDMGFMSMIDVTKDLPRSGDGLQMEWIDAPFGPFFPGLPGGLLLTLTLDGDTVAGSEALALNGNRELLCHSPMDATHFIERMADLDPLAPVAYRLLACQALEKAAGEKVPAETAQARAGALERERIVSHLGWLALFGQQTGFDWLVQRAAVLQLDFRHADMKQVAALRPAIQSLMKRLQRTPLLKSRIAGIGRLAQDTALRGPVARASGISDDARNTDKTFITLGFTPARRKEGDALARLHVRLDEITHSLMLIESAGAIAVPTPPLPGEASGSSEASVETPRGPARLQLTLETGQVTAAQLETPSTHHLTLIAPLTEQQELGDALVAVGSLDLSPWEVRQ
ncbi:Ni,Fe-hydrogenase III large subunit [Thiogranum longum]|uniref:Ni,Fe-hydrogenase III large subunit n=1 Tax=Thiogranum longum TaxID=1537524 RepID=A0A4R1H853_9GAMM|nr:heavy metal-binding domain-containing protein [Thiogranum longum]TCK18017.1 Ni,Fe-hydrogenase III large subunit [Thiogranum longum]